MRKILPIDHYLPEITKILSSGKNLILVAEPGSGKTTRAPLSLLDADWLKGKKILMLEPRRLAAKAAANFISSQISEKTGNKVGYRIRGESKISRNTRLEIITEGLLTRIIQEDPAIEDTGLIVFDEFHERSIHADLSLALALDSQKHLRPDLRILIMSATIDADAVSSMVGNSKIIDCPGKVFPVDLRYGRPLEMRYIDKPVVDTIKKALREEEGDILVFLPGRAEITRIANNLRGSDILNNVDILTLHSDIRGEEQDRILSPKDSDPRRIILSTNVAETSVTIPRVRIVVDSGLMRVPRFNPRRGSSGLETLSVSKASATQRAGRAGREAAGVCYRLWTAQEESAFAPFNQPEVLYADLAQFILELAAWGNSEPKSYSFMTALPSAHVSQAKDLLQTLGAIDNNGVITSHGKELLRLSLPPRLSSMLLHAANLGSGKEACELIALLEESLPTSDRELDSIVSNRLEELRRSKEGRGIYSKATVYRITDETERLKSLIKVSYSNKGNSLLSTGALVALAYPDRLAKQREPGSNRFLLRNGSGAVVPEHSVFTRHEYLAVAHLDGLGENSKVFLAEPLTIDEIRKIFKENIESRREVIFSKDGSSIRAKEFEALGALILSEKLVPLNDEDTAPMLLQLIRNRGLESLPLSKNLKSLIERVNWLKVNVKNLSEFPDLSTEGLLSDLENWLLPFLSGIRSLEDIKTETLEAAINLKLNRNLHKLLDELAPSHLTLPSGRSTEISYSGPRAPSISGKLQEMFGQTFTPRIAGGAVALSIELLSPAGRPLQVTSDLESFWNNSYQDVRKEMAGRYPKHSWPLNPRETPAMIGAKRRSK